MNQHNQRTDEQSNRAPIGRQRLFFKLLLLIIVLNFYDIVHTLQLCAAGQAVEGNPLMRPLLDAGPAVAIGVKMAIALLFAFIISMYAKLHFRRAFIAASVVAVCYGLVAFWHLTGMFITAWYVSSFS